MSKLFSYLKNKISYKLFTPMQSPVLINNRSVKKEKHIVDMIPTFYFQGAFRCVKIYHHTYKTFTKKRWIQMKIIDMFVKEFAAYDAAYYVFSNYSPHFINFQGKSHS